MEVSHPVEFSHPVLVCDIGGTNTRVAVVREKKAEVELLAHLKTADFPDLGAAVETALKVSDVKIRSLIACGAGPLSGRSLHLTNASWQVDGPSLADRLKLDQGLLLNDFEAQAIALPSLHKEWLKPIGPVAQKQEAGGARLVLGPGTGLGVAALFEANGRFLPLASEAGHMDFGPSSAEERKLWPHLEPPTGRVSAETVISGPGLARVHRARLIGEGKSAPHIDSAAIVDRALQHRSGEEAHTVRVFWRLVARYASDMALAFLARSGVTLSGGVLPRIFDLLDPDDFRKAFEDKAPMAELARAIPTALVIAPDAVLAGMAAIAADPARYELDYGRRAWRPIQAA